MIHQQEKILKNQNVRVVSHDASLEAMRRTMSNLLRVLLLGRLAGYKRFHNQGIGKAKLSDVMCGQSRSRGMRGYWLFWFMLCPNKRNNLIFYRGLYSHLCRQ